MGAPPLSWSGALPVDTGQSLTSISCPSLELCVAVDGAGHALVSTRPAVAEAAAWSAPFALPGAGPLDSVSCPTTALCVAVDREGHALLSTHPATAAPGAWSNAFPLHNAGALSSVSCASASLCVAVSSGGKMSFSTNPAAGEGAWSEATALAGMGALSSVSCSSPALCAAVDGEGRIAISGEPASGAASWHARLIDPSLGLASVSCFAGACVAADSQGNALSSPNASQNAGTGAGSGATWSSTLIDLGGSPTALSCSRSALCALVDSAGYAYASDGAIAAPPAWSNTPIDAGHALKAVSCTASGLCAAGDSSGRVLVGLLPAPAASTGVASASHTTATLTGTALPQDATIESCTFEYGHTAAYGSSVPCAAIGEGGAPQGVEATVGGLTAGSAYHYRLIVSDGRGGGIGADSAFQTLAPYLVEPHPSISGTPAAGQKLTCRSGVSATGVTVAYQWLRDTSPIAGATSTVYAVGASDVSHHLQCRVTATTEEGAKSAASSFVSVPAGGVGTVIESSAGTPRALGDTIEVPLRCSPSAVTAGCTINLRASLASAPRPSSSGVPPSASARAKRRTAALPASAAGRRLIARHHHLAAHLTVRGTSWG